ncbi:potassium voltage-gated channel subfamily A member 3-like [Hydractinia symbiolongicarpus]|uniref:potassium voltage-gated channel subfamily A member 3-like n=1 Tax=Hydractinia symbiolongicarpus TaxID=13093 RepID=UPI00254EB71F|nr:potassium voltage-gated channel subfamily A member 3-like [Hydractinia symbiolongicarpus]
MILNEERVKLNISGKIFETYKDTLERYPKTLLGDPVSRKVFYCKRKNEYFLACKRSCFDAILFFYQSYGRLSCPSGTRIDDFINECHYFKLPIEYINKMAEVEGWLYTNETQDVNLDERLPNKIWIIFEYLESSRLSHAYAFFSFFFIFISIVAACLETVPSLASSSVHSTKNPWHALELCLNTLFLIELTARYIVAPNKKTFVMDYLNLVDCLAIFPYFVMIAFIGHSKMKLNFLRILRVIRVVRLLRISRHSRNLHVACAIIKSCFNDLQLFAVFFLITMTLGGSLMYFIEKEVSGTMYTSIPASFWWGVQTISTVGYGDIHPQTTVGKIICGCFMTTTIILTAIPVLSIVNKFEMMYEKNIYSSRLTE